MPQGADPQAENNGTAHEAWGRDAIVFVAVLVYAVALPLAGFLVDLALGFFAIAVVAVSVAAFVSMGVATWYSNVELGILDDEDWQ